MKTPFLLGLLLATSTLRAAETPPGPSANTPAPGSDAARLAWWREARFGLFIHWGPVSLKGTEIGWSRGGERRGYSFGPGNQIPVDVYDNLYKEFNPVRFNADEWIAVAQAAGMKYLVFTSRHHDGFSMFDTQASNYKITAPESPFRRDVVKELGDACHRAGLRFGLYYSQPDWRHPDAFTDRHANYLAYLKTQVRELVTRYGRLDILWYDGLGKSAADYDAVALNRMVRELQPAILINNRNGLPEDFDTPEQVVGKFQYDRPWESCITIGDQWAWKPDDRLKSLKQCLDTLIRCAGGDGNLLFNVGPMPDGRIEPRQVERLKEMGAWLAKYGTTIYGTRGGPWKPGADLASTRRGNTVFVHILRWKDDSLTLPALPRRIVRHAVLTGGSATVQQRPDGVVLSVPAADRDAIATILQLELDGSAMDLAPLDRPSSSRATASNVYQQMEDFGPDKAFDDDPHTRWATDAGTRQAWIALDLGKPTRFDGVAIHEAYAGRVQQFEFQSRNGGEWKTVFTGTTLGAEFTRRFPAVTAREIRLRIGEATEGPTLTEIRLLGTDAP
ncbi:MAG: alpha-L-fucosidase [Verrucomicrobiales bacterium]|nr:alpha-L-fucosidase [Verrucomicrobiales bacterium]